MGLYGVVIGCIIIDHTYFRGKGKPPIDGLLLLYCFQGNEKPPVEGKPQLYWAFRLPKSRLYAHFKQLPMKKMFMLLPKRLAGWVLFGGLKLIEKCTIDL